jgi:hypothetical protein
VVQRQVDLLGEEDDAEHVQHSSACQAAPPDAASLAPGRGKGQQAPHRCTEEKQEEQPVAHVAVEGRLHRGIGAAIHLLHGQVHVGRIGPEEAGHDAQ